MAIRISWREHVAKDGKVTRYARYRIPHRGEGGALRFRPVERSVGSLSKREGAKLVAEWFKEAAQAAKAEATEDPTLAEIILTYQRTVGASPYFAPILRQAGNRPISEITQALMTELAAKIYPDRTAATINRQLFTPIIASLRLFGDEGKKIASRLTRPRGHDSLPDLDVPANDWYRAVLPHANPWLRAFLIVGRLHGRRPGEYLNRRRSHFNAQERTLLVRDNKGRQNLVIKLSEPAWAALMALPDMTDVERLRVTSAGEKAQRLTKNKREWLFGTNQRTTMRYWLKLACKDAGVRYHMPKEAGRHAFVTAHLAEGKSLKWVQAAGDWKTLTTPANKYAHLEKSEVKEQVTESGESWFGNNVGNVASARSLVVANGEVQETETPLERGDGVGTEKKDAG